MAVLCQSASPSLHSMISETHMLMGPPQMMDDPFYLDCSQWTSGGGGGGGGGGRLLEGPARSYATLAIHSVPHPYDTTTVSSTQFHAIQIAPSNTQLSKFDADDVNLDSWQKTHPELWTSEDVLNLIYFIALKSNDIEFANLHGEQFQNVGGAELCSMTERDFILKDPKYGKTLYGCVRTLLQNSQFLPPEEAVCVKQEEPDCLKSIKTEIPRSVAELSCEESSDMFDDERRNVISMFGINYDIDSAADFGNIQPTSNVILSSSVSSSSSFSSMSSSSSSSNVCVDTTCMDADQKSAVESQYDDNRAYHLSLYPDFHQPHQHQQQHLHREHSLVPDSSVSGGTPFPMDLRRNHEPDSAASDVFLYQSDRTKKHCRRDKSMSSDGEGGSSPSSSSSSIQGFSDVNRSNNLGKGNHLWEFLCQLLRMSESVPAKDRIIQWESRDEGIFRIIDSKEVASLWGEHKNNKNMTYEKLSRALRWCRTFGFLAALPKDGKFPKKLCFRFGPRAASWRHFL